jgi:hypothetical protein
MPSPETLPPIAPAPAGLADHTKASAAALYKGQGYDDAALTAAGYGGAAPAVVTDNTPLVQTGGNTFLRNDGISHDQAVSAAKNLIAHGVDPATVLEAAISQGVTAADLAVKPAPEAVAAAQRDAATAKGFEAPAAGERYELNYGQEFAAASDTADLATLDRDIQSAFTAAGVPKNLAQPLLDSLLSTGAMYADEDMSDEAKQMLWRDQGSILRHTVSDLAEHSRLAAIGYAALPKSFRDDMDSSYAGHSAAAQIQLAALGRALEYRSKK